MTVKSFIRWDEQILNAFLDGELDSKTTSIIDEAMKQDLNVRSFVQKRRNINKLTSEAFSEIDKEPLSDGLQHLIDSQCSKKPTFNFDFSNIEKSMFSMAASFLLLIFGFGAGFFTSGLSIEGNPADVKATVRTNTLKEMVSVHNQALETAPSGQPVSWSGNNASAEFIPVRTLKTKDNQYCREFKEILIIDGNKETRHGISCREGKENWHTKVLFHPSGQKIL